MFYRIWVDLCQNGSLEKKNTESSSRKQSDEKSSEKSQTEMAQPMMLQITDSKFNKDQSAVFKLRQKWRRTFGYKENQLSRSGSNERRPPTLLRRGENRITRIAIAIVWLFLFCHFWRLVPTFYEAVHASHSNWPAWLMHVHDISHSLIVFNSAVNFLLYTLL